MLEYFPPPALSLQLLALDASLTDYTELAVVKAYAQHEVIRCFLATSAGHTVDLPGGIS